MVDDILLLIANTAMFKVATMINRVFPIVYPSFEGKSPYYLTHALQMFLLLANSTLHFHALVHARNRNHTSFFLSISIFRISPS